MENQVKAESGEKATEGQMEINSRRRFIGAAAAALFAGVVITLTGCDDDKGNGSTGGTDRVGTVTNNHGHVVKVTKAQIDAGVDLTLNIQGTADHSHTLTLTSDHLQTLKSGGMIHMGLETAEGGSPLHTHVVMFM